MRTAERYEVYLVELDPVQGSEIAKTRPCVVVSPDELNRVVRTVIVAPLTSASRSVPFRVASVFAGHSGTIAVDHIRSVDKTRLVRRLGRLDKPTADAVSTTLLAMFRP